MDLGWKYPVGQEILWKRPNGRCSDPDKMAIVIAHIPSIGQAAMSEVILQNKIRKTFAIQKTMNFSSLPRSLIRDKLSTAYFLSNKRERYLLWVPEPEPREHRSWFRTPLRTKMES